jgi:CheY-like chemotaxis protein
MRTSAPAALGAAMILASAKRPVRTLLVEDSPVDIRLAREALREVAIDHELHVVTDGDQALEFLHRTSRFPEAPRPDLLILDLNLPRRDGREVLAEIKADPSLRRIPVIILTTSASQDDVATAYDHFVNCYVTKPSDMDAFVSVLRAVYGFWAGIVTLPEEVD